jgi:DNA-binding cell septation regulator SpoVG
MGVDTMKFNFGEFKMVKSINLDKMQIRKYDNDDRVYRFIAETNVDDEFIISGLKIEMVEGVDLELNGKFVSVNNFVDVQNNFVIFVVGHTKYTFKRK